MKIIETSWFHKVGERALDLLFPPHCALCRKSLEQFPDGVGLCSDCRERLPLTDWPTCRRCAARVPEIPGTVDECGHCRGNKLRFDRAMALGPHLGELRDLILKMKEDHTNSLATLLGGLIALHLGESIRELQADCIVPIPIHSGRRFSRRADSSLSLARVLGRRLDIPVAENLLEWRRNTSSQLGLTREGRIRNMQGVMRVRAGYYLDAPHLLLVDDTMTTGATCSEAARTLKKSGVARVTVVVVGRTPA